MTGLPLLRDRPTRRGARAALGTLAALLLGAGALAQVPPAVHMPPAPPAPGTPTPPVAPGVPGAAVTPAPAMTPSGRVTPGGVRNARRHAQDEGDPAAAGDVTEAGDAPDAAGTAGRPAPPAPPSQWSDAQVRQAFRYADSDGDGVLTRAEAQRLPLLPRSFEDLDVNKDGVLDLDEYRAGFPR